MMTRHRPLLLGLAVIPPLIAAGPAAAQQGDVPLRGIVKAVRQASISSDLGFKIIEMPFQEGQSFKAGDTLVAFDCEGLRAEMRGSEARLASERLVHDNNIRLAKLNAAGKFEVRLSQSKADQAAAEVDTYRAKAKQCILKAPFDGSVAVRVANAFEIPERSRPLLQIVGDKDLEIEMLLPGNWLRWLKPGANFSLMIEETSKDLPAEVVRIAPIVDPVSQTVKVIARFTGDATGVLPGMSGPARFPASNG
jgi:membrane fusion protein (multidrug efflux system)